MSKAACRAPRARRESAQALQGHAAPDGPAAPRRGMPAQRLDPAPAVRASPVADGIRLHTQRYSDLGSAQALLRAQQRAPDPPRHTHASAQAAPALRAPHPTAQGSASSTPVASPSHADGRMEHIRQGCLPGEPCAAASRAAHAGQTDLRRGKASSLPWSPGASAARGEAEFRGTSGSACP